MIISFGLTTKEFRAGIKTETRRAWKPRTLERWQSAWDRGHILHQAVDKGLHRGGKRIGRLRLTARPVLEPVHSMTAGSIHREGLTRRVGSVKEFCELTGFVPEQWVAVIRFEKL